MLSDLTQVSHSAIGVVVYLGVFPAALGYILWAYALSHLPTTQVVSYLYFSPFIATLIGWLWLDEVPTIMSLIGGVLAMIGVYFVNRSYFHSKRPNNSQ
jgi:drug/metabolite transporter (DMT)-like permease